MNKNQQSKHGFYLKLHIDWLIDRCYTFYQQYSYFTHLMAVKATKMSQSETIATISTSIFNNKSTKNINDENERNIISGDSWISRGVIYIHTQTIYLPTQTDFLVLIFHTPEKKVKMSLRKKTCSLSSEGKKVF